MMAIPVLSAVVLAHYVDTDGFWVVVELDRDCADIDWLLHHTVLLDHKERAVIRRVEHVTLGSGGVTILPSLPLHHKDHMALLIEREEEVL